MLPITTGIIPFGAVMGTVSAEVKLTLFQTVCMNVLVFAGASQMASLDLLVKHTPILVVVFTGIVINLRFLLYSAAIAPNLENASFLKRVVTAYFLTDQNYAVMSANTSKWTQASERIWFYLGASSCMVLAWHGAVISGFIFGNFAPASWSLDFAVPLSFVALIIPTLKSRMHWLVAGVSLSTALLTHELPMRLGLIVSAVIAMSAAIFLIKRVRYP